MLPTFLGMVENLQEFTRQRDELQVPQAHRHILHKPQPPWLMLSALLAGVCHQHWLSCGTFLNWTFVTATPPWPINNQFSVCFPPPGMIPFTWAGVFSQCSHLFYFWKFMKFHLLLNRKWKYDFRLPDSLTLTYPAKYFRASWCLLSSEYRTGIWKTCPVRPGETQMLSLQL